MRRSRGGRGASSVATPRGVAHAVLVRVERDDAWADRVLATALSRSSMSSRDVALTTELVYGTLRQQPWIDFLLGALARRPLRKLPHATLVALRLGAYQIVATRVPPHTAIDETVSLVREFHPRLSGMANAMLRRLAEHHEAGTLPDPASSCADPLEAAALRGSHPPWLVAKVAALRGEEEARAWIEANNRAPPVVLRVNPLRSERTAVAAALREAGIDATLPEGVPDAVVVRGGGRVDGLPGFAEGHFVVQDIGAQLAGRLCRPRPGAVVLDACAAPGGKSTHLAEQMRGDGRVIAVDRHPGKTRLIAATAERLGHRCVEVGSVDASDPAALRDFLAERGVEAVDLAVLDAPCSGTGTLRRHPELRRRSPDDVARLSAVQASLLESVAGVVAPGGALVYMVCSILPEEGRERVDAFLADHPDFEVAGAGDPVLLPYLEDHPRAPRSLLTTWPHLHEADGFFAVRLERRPGP